MLEFNHIASLFLGVALGCYYFGGLWLTVRLLPKVRRAKRLLMVSFAARLIPTLAGMYAVIVAHPTDFILTVSSFFVCRYIALKIVNRPLHKRECYHAA